MAIDWGILSKEFDDKLDSLSDEDWFKWYTSKEDQSREQYNELLKQSQKFNSDHAALIQAEEYKTHEVPHEHLVVKG